MKKYIITTYTPGLDISYKYLWSLKLYAKVNNAKLLILTTKELNKDAVVPNDVAPYIVHDSIQLNNNLIAKSLPSSPFAANPISGLQSQAHGSLSLLVPGHKQVLKHLPSYDGVRVITSTGSCNERSALPYTNAAQKLMSEFVQGAMIVEILNKKHFLLRNIIADKSGRFCDLDKVYDKSEIYKNKIESLIAGDLHSEEHDSEVVDILLKVGSKFKIPSIFLHDVFSGSRVTHHIGHNHVLRAKLAEGTLKQDFKEFTQLIKRFEDTFKSVFIIKSNHDDHTDKWVSEGRFIIDAINAPLGAELLHARLNLKQNSNEYILREAGSKAIILEESMNIKSGNYLVSKHGHAWSGNPKGLRAITGHTHSGELKPDGSIVVGHSSDMSKQDYLNGANAWTHSFALISKITGFAQLITIINGKWR